MPPPLSYPSALLATAAALAVGGAALRCSSRLPPGHPVTGALVALLTAINILIPLLLFDGYSAYSTRGMLGFAVSWLASSKAIALYCGRGQLAGGQRWTAVQFVALYALPLLPAEEEDAVEAASKPGSASLAARTAGGAALTLACVLGVVAGPPLVVKQLLLALAMYAWLGFQLDIVAAVAGQMGLPLGPHFRPPWEARSIADFWGRHWNLSASNAVRIAVYEPLCEGVWVRWQGRGPAAAADAAAAKPAGGRRGVERVQREGALRRQHGVAAQRASVAAAGPARPALALCAACLTSGLVHEYLVWLIAGASTHGMWLLFFALQGPLILAERRMFSWLGQADVKLPGPLRTLLALGTLLALAHHLFFNPVERLPLMARAVEQWRQAIAAVAGTAAPLP